VIPIVVCTVGSPSLPVLEASVKAYCPEVKLFVSKGSKGNFGDDYNDAVNIAFEKYDEIIVANDDIVLTPSSYKLLLEDVEQLKKSYKVGWVAARSDEVRPMQMGKSNQILAVPVISPLFSYISKEAWENFPPINWYSDDVQCIDISKKGFKHFVSRAYVHHVGSGTIGQDNNKNHLAAEPWIKANRPELHKVWFNTRELKIA
jgi:hypothetical protein